MSASPHTLPRFTTVKTHDRTEPFIDNLGTLHHYRLRLYQHPCFPPIAVASELSLEELIGHRLEWLAGALLVTHLAHRDGTPTPFVLIFHRPAEHVAQLRIADEMLYAVTFESWHAQHVGDWGGRLRAHLGAPRGQRITRHAVERLTCEPLDVDEPVDVRERMPALVGVNGQLGAPGEGANPIADLMPRPIPHLDSQPEQW